VKTRFFRVKKSFKKRKTFSDLKYEKKYIFHTHVDLFPSAVIDPITNPQATLYTYRTAALAAKFNIASVRWQHPLHVAIVPPESKGKTEENNWDTACGNFKTSISSIYYNNNVFVPFHYQNNFKFIIPLLFGGDIYRQHVTTFSRLA
jgi:hypothetical protein